MPEGGFDSSTIEGRQHALDAYYIDQAEKQGHFLKSPAWAQDAQRTNANKAGFNIPMSTYPYSSSSSAQNSTSAIDWSSQLGQTLLPMIQNWSKRIPGLAENLSETLQGQYKTMMREALQPQAFQGVLNQLANRGVLDSSITSNALSDTASRIAEGIGKQGYLSALQGIDAQMRVPGMLGQIAELARTSEAQAVSRAESGNPLAPYELMAKMMMY